MCYKVIIVRVLYLFWLVPGFSPKNFGYFQNVCFKWNENKIEINFVSKLIWSRTSHWNKTSTQTFHKITYNTIILARHAIQFLDLNVLYISKVLAFLDYILSLAKARDKNFIKLRTKKTVYINSYYDLNKKCE